MNNNAASYDVVLSTLDSKKSAAYRLCGAAYDIATDCEKITSIKLTVYMSKDRISDEYGKKPAFRPIYGYN